MSKTIRKRRPARKHAEPAKEKLVSPEKREKIKHLIVLVVIVILSAIPFTMGKYFEFNSPGAFDSGGYVYSAKHILDGAEIGVEEKTSAQLGTLLVNILGVRLFGFNETGPKLIQTILQIGALLLMFVAMRKLFGTLSAAVGVILASVYLSAPVIAKFGNVKEQYMIAFMVMGISCFVLYQLSPRWWYAVLAGAFLIWAPLFKATGLSALGAVGLFVMLQPLLKNRTWRQTRSDILLLLAGAAGAIAPAYIWLIGWNVQMSLPYEVIWETLVKFLPGGSESGQTQAASDYVSASQKHISFSQLCPRVLRYYGVLILPIALAAAALITRVLRLIFSAASTKKRQAGSYDRFVLLFATWWILDMAFVWVSPRSYEQYYLPLNASAAMLGGYLIAIYSDKAKNAASRPKWIAIGVLGFILMMIMSWHIFFGIAKSPHSDTIYRSPTTGLPQKRRGYAQKLKDIYLRRRDNYRGDWELLGEYIRSNSAPSDGIYIWGWYPGIYVTAQRLSPAPKAFEGTMHTLPPEALSERIDEILSSFKKQPPKFIVDSRKSHFPWDRPPLELWPQTQKGFLPANEQVVSQYDAAYAKILREKIEPDEALRYEQMKPFREFVMKNYRVVRTFGQHVLFEREYTQQMQPGGQKSDKADG
ncbi:MAG: ArnT family glycosyltransferase [Planctomycetota bacterium]|jgi:hypothetical protein